MDSDILRLDHRIDLLALRLQGIEDLLGVRAPAETEPPTPTAIPGAVSEPHVAAVPTPPPMAEPPPLPGWVTREAASLPAAALEAGGASLAESLLAKSQRAQRDRAGMEVPAATITDAAEPFPAPAFPPATAPGLAGLDAAAAPVAAGSSAIPTRPAKPLRIKRDLERLIGGRWYAVIGALAVVIGIGLFFKLGYERGWFNMAPWARCMAGAAFGMVLLGAGEWIRRKINNLAAEGVVSAGLGTIYASVYAAYRLHDLLPQVGAFALLAATALLGVLVAARTRLIFVATLSLTAGYITPFLLTTVEPKPMVLPAYLLMLLAVGLILCAKMGRDFAPLRTLVWWATLGIGALWEITQGIAQGGLGAAFAAVVWAALHAELIFSAGRWGLQRVEGTPATDSTRPGLKRWSPLIASFSTTAWAVTFGSLALGNTLAPDWIAPAAGLVAAAILANVLAGGLRGLTDAPTTDSERLGACLWVQAAGLLFATFALALAGWAEAACWIALGLSAIVAARWLRARAFDVYGLGVLAFCVARLMIYDSWAAGLAAGGALIWGLHLTSWTLLVAVAGGAWLGASRLVLPRGEERQGRFGGAWVVVSDLAACIGLSVLGASLIHGGMTGETLAGVMLATAVGTLAWGRGLRTTAVLGFGVLVLALATAASGLLHLSAWTRPVGTTAGLSLTTAAGVLLASAAVWAGMSVMMRRWRSMPESSGGCVWGVPSVVLSDFSACAALTLVPLALMHPGIDLTLASVLLTLAGVATIVWARLVRSAPGVAYAAVLLVVGAGTAAASQWWMTGSDDTWQMLGLVLTTDAFAPLLNGAAWVLLSVAWATWSDSQGLSQRGLLQLAWAPAAAGPALLGCGLCHVEMASGWVALIPLVLGAACVVVRRALPPLRMDAIGMCGLALAGLGWMVTYVLRGWEETDLGWPIHPGLLVALAVIAAWVWVSRLEIALSKEAWQTRLGWRIAAVALAFVASSFEVARLAGQLAQDRAVQGAAVSIWWGLFAFALIGAGFWKRLALSRRAGLVLLAAASLKALLLDLSGAPAGWRVASFIGLGLLMLGVAVVYQKVAARESPEPRSEG